MGRFLIGTVPFAFHIFFCMLTSPTRESRSRRSPAAHSQPDMTNITLVGQLEGELIAPAAVARLLNLSRQSVYRLIARGMLPVYKLCRHLRVRRADLEALIARSRETVGFTHYGREKD